MGFLLENIDVNGQMMRFSPFLMLINVAVFFCFIFSYFKMYKGTGKVIDYWYFISLQFFIIPIVIMYPFSSSSGNIIATGGAYYTLEPYVNTAYMISLVGYFSFVIGGGVAGKNAIKIKFFERCYTPLKDTFNLAVFSFFLLLMFAIFFAFQFYTGNFQNPRLFFMEHPIYRPIYNFVVSYFKVMVVILGAFCVDSKNKKWALVLAVICLLGVSLGTRSSIIDSICYIAFLFFISSGKKIKFWHAVLFTAFVFIAVFALEIVRSGHSSGVFYNIIYGNTFSDVRDFAWILSYWDFKYIHGRTYISGIISFIPSSMSDYREIWAISRYTNKFVGFDSLVHPGLRPGKFGEPFFNFGIIGVILLGGGLGYCLKRVSNEINVIIKSTVEGKALRIFLTTLPFQFVSMFCLTSGFFEFYVLVLVILCMVIFYYFSRKIMYMAIER